MKLVARIEDSFVIPSIAERYGCVITLKFITDDGRLRIKDEIQLRTPDGRVKNTYIADVPHFVYRPDVPAEQRKPSIALPPEIKKEDVPTGTEVWAKGAGMAPRA